MIAIRNQRMQWHHGLITLAVVVGLAVPAWAQDRAQQLAVEIDDYMKAATAVDQFSGSILVARDGQPLLSKGYGMANYELSVANTPQTVFRLGSLTKQFTAMAVMMLQERGKLQVSDRICRYLTDCPMAWQRITVRNLLTHTSGIPNYSATPEYEAAKTLAMPQANLIAGLKNRVLDFQPGETYRYSNSGYYLLGVIIEQVSGVPYETFLRDNIFTPLAMTSTGYDSSRAIIKNRAAGYARQGDELVNADFLHMSLPFAGGALYSTVEDLLRWDQALYSNKLLSRKSLDEMFTPFKNGYGYGWNRRTKFDRQALEHEGGIEGFNTFISRFPDERVTVIVLSNTESRTAAPVAEALAAIVFNAPYRKPARTEISVAAATLNQYVGQYRLPNGNILNISIENGALIWQVPGQPKFVLTPQSETEFVEKTGNVRVSFVTDAQGRVTSLVRRRGSNEATMPRIQ